MFSTVTLARWLGPWADPKRAPDVAIEDHDVDGMRVRCFGRPPGKPYLIAPGLHYAGADDPRMDRFCRILAAAGHHVIAPYIPSFLALRPDAAAKRDFIKAFHALPRWTGRTFGAAKPVVFSISFGSLLAFALAAEYGDDVDRLVIFGGYSDFREMLKFCLTGSVSSLDSGSRSARPLATQPLHGPRLASVRSAVRDPLNQPVVLMNLLHLIECADRDAVSEGWRRYVTSTWGRPEMKERARFVAVAEQLAPSVPAAVRELFLIGIGALPGAAPLALDALTRFDASELDPAPYLPRVKNRVDLVHGADDDVIPYEHSHALDELLPNARVHVTGMYGHTGVSRPGVSMITRELATMIRVLRVLL